MMKYRSFPLVALVGALVAGSAVAGPLTIAPTTLEIAPNRQSAMLSVTNDSDQPIDLQFRAYAWTQPDGGEALLPTGDLIISPAIITVAPHKRQTFRVLRVKTTQSGPEPSYRLRLNELPRPGATGVAINLEFSIPVFMTGTGAHSALSWRREGGTVTVVNDGTRRARLGALTIAGPGGAPVTVRGATSTYVLAGAHKTFALDEPRRLLPGAVRLTGTADSGAIDLAETERPDAVRVQSAAR